MVRPTSLLRSISNSVCTIALLAILVAPTPTPATNLEWRDDDWSGGRYAGASGVDPEVAPGHLVLNNDLGDLRFVANPTHFQGLYSMAAYHDTLFITASDYPYMFDGADVIAYDYLRDSFEVVYQPYESGLHMIKAIGDTLYLPGPDTMDNSMLPGSIYTYNGDEWREKETLPHAIHVNDVDIVNNVVYTTTGQFDGQGCLWRSTDWGDTFTPIRCVAQTFEQPWRRLFGIGHIGNRIFVQPDGFAPETNLLFTSTDGINWQTSTVPHMPVDKMAMFTNWHGQLLMTMDNRMYAWNGVTWLEYNLPFSGWRWCRGIHGYKSDLYGGANTCWIYRWRGGSNWEPIGSLDVDSTSTEIEAMATYYGRLYISTSRPVQGGSMLPGLYVSASIPSGFLLSLPHDFGTRTTNGRINWSEYRPAPGHQALLQIRSALTAEELASRPFVGPDGTDGSYYNAPNSPLAQIHVGDRFFQYRVELRCPQRMRMPVLHEVEILADSLQFPSGFTEDPEHSPSHAPGSAYLLEVGMPFPNPAQDGVYLELTVRASGEEASRGTPALSRMLVTDLQGRVLRSETIHLAPGSRNVWRWDLRDAEGRRVPSGTYWLRVEPVGAVSEGASRSVRVLR